jgi:hypothetical protein
MFHVEHWDEGRNFGLDAMDSRAADAMGGRFGRSTWNIHSSSVRRQRADEQESLLGANDLQRGAPIPARMG